MEACITLWNCPPLRARISQRQCALNRARAGAGDSRLPALHDPGQGPIQCVGCRGVEWWAEQTGEAPRQVATPDLVRQHAEKEAQRRRLGGASPSARATAGHGRRRARLSA